MKRGFFGKRLRARRVGESNTLRNDVADSRSDAGVDQVLRAHFSK